MTAGNQCDNCGRFGTPASVRWLYLITQPETSHPLMAALGVASTEPLSFCCLPCLVAWAVAAAAVSEPATGAEPEPRDTSTGGPDPPPR